MPQLVSINLLRSIAIFLMFITHSIRLLPKNVWSENIIFCFFMEIEPFTSALFLFLVGYSIDISLKKWLFKNLDKKNWKKKQIIRSIFLYIIGVFIFTAQFGIQFPDFLLSPNILSSIAISILINSLLIDSKKSAIFTILFLSLLEFFLDYLAVGISGLNKGPGGSLILVCFSILGKICSSYNIPKKILWISLTLGLVSLWFPWKIYYEEFYESTNFIVKFSAKNVRFWNHTSFSFLGISAILVLISNLVYKFKITNFFWSSVSIIGKNSLDLYIGHLFIISVFSLFNVINSSGKCFIFIVILTLVSYLYSFLKELLTKKKT